MKSILLSLFTISFPLMSWGQSNLENLDIELKGYENSLTRQKDISNKHKKDYERQLVSIQKSKDEIVSLEAYEKQFDNARTNVLKELDKTLSSFSFFQRMGSKPKYYSCLKDSLEKGHLNTGDCSRQHDPKLSKNELEEIKSWHKSVGRPKEEISRAKEWAIQDISNSTERVKKLKSEYEKSLGTEERIKSEIKIIEVKRNEIELLPKYSHITNCNENTPEINLEEKKPYAGAKFDGAFYGVPRDNQDGLGTCYANVAKNLLVGVSDGKEVASFLDIALQYKAKNNEVEQEGLDAGDPCSALDALKDVGLCSQKYSPIETGDRNELGEGLFNLKPNEYLATNIDLIREFVNHLGSFEKSVDGLGESILPKAKKILDDLKSNSDIHLPLPIVDHEIPPLSKVAESYYLNKSNINLSLEDFQKEYKEAYKKFYPHYLKGIVAKKSLDQIFEIYKKEMEPFISKYKMERFLNGYKLVYKLDAEKDFKDPALNRKLRESLDYLKEIMNKKDLSDDSFINFCAEDGMETFKFLASMNPIVKKLRENNLNGDLLFDKDGKFKAAKDLLQLAVAPSCINTSNRRTTPPLMCARDDLTQLKKMKIPENEKIKKLREKVVLSLMQGLPLGNTFPTSTGGYHINTIVGLKFDRASGQCQYRIRESQNGTSSWTNEKEIFKKIKILTEVRKK